MGVLIVDSHETSEKKDGILLNHTTKEGEGAKKVAITKEVP